MLTGAIGAELYAHWLDYITDADAKDAFLYLVGIAAASHRYACEIEHKGPILNFRFHDPASGEQPHSFITNRGHLLFYLRSRSVRSGAYSKEALKADFDTFEETNGGEWHVEIRNIADVKRLGGHINWRGP